MNARTLSAAGGTSSFVLVFQTGDDKSHLESIATSSEGTTADVSAGSALEHEALEVGVQVRKDAEWRRRGALK